MWPELRRRREASVRRSKGREHNFSCGRGESEVCSAASGCSAAVPSAAWLPGAEGWARAQSSGRLVRRRVCRGILVLVVSGRVAVEWGQVPGGIVRRVCHRTVCWLQSAAWPLSRQGVYRKPRWVCLDPCTGSHRPRGRGGGSDVYGPIAVLWYGVAAARVSSY